ncbi:glycosyltransferase family 4 protein [Sphingobacteriaceae bacterium WQ 2009]|uniref:Glycosyltransferase family 4 protein n=1 Tax=Rhinopithecimicrobium faecis TaxID=2820698 RepID=A0A8T4H7C1_9SPHI|nr:glycosyltransferase family 4 protein [Sphingobacteriaceae bacterium WQ 2009]
MKIVYLHQYFKQPNENGGTRSYDLSKSFVNNGFEVEVITTTSNNFGFNGKNWRIEDLDGIKIHYLYLPYDNSFSYLKRIFVFISFLFFSTIKLLSIKTDLVLATSTPLTIGIPALIKKIIHRSPFIFEVRDVWPEAVVAIGAVKNKVIIKLLLKLEYLLYKYSDSIVPLSRDMKSSIISRYPEFSTKAEVVIENISEIDRFNINYQNKYLFNALGFNPKRSILYAGTFGKVNNIDYILNLAEKTFEIDPDLIFILVGEGSEKDRLIEKSKALNIFNKNLFFIASVSKSDLPKVYSEVTCGSSFVAPIEELWANSANKFFDSLAAGKPIVINHFGWQSEVIIKENIGFTLNPDIEKVNILEFVNFVNDSSKIYQMGLNARDIAVKNYSLTIASSKYLSIINRIKNKFNV